MNAIEARQRVEDALAQEQIENDERKRLKEEENLLRNRLKFERTMKVFDELLEKAVRNKKYSFVLTRLDYEDHVDYPSRSCHKIENEKRCAQWVKDVLSAIRRNGFIVSINYNHDGVGISSWLEIVVSY